MAYQFGGMLYRNSREMHVAIAEEWLSAGGRNTREEMLDYLSIMSDVDLMSEVMGAWDSEDFCSDELRDAFSHIRNCFDDHFPQSISASELREFGRAFEALSHPGKVG